MTLDLRPELDTPYRIFGVPAIVTATGASPVETAVVWEGLPPGVVSAGDERAADRPRRTLRVRRDDVAELFPHNQARIVAPERLGEPERTWEVDAVEVLSDEEFRVHVLPRP